jgi:hypothetical protein
MKAKEIIATTLGAMRTEATRIVEPHMGNIEATMVKIVDLLDTLPENLNIDLHVEVEFSGDQEAQ